MIDSICPDGHPLILFGNTRIVYCVINDEEYSALFHMSCVMRKPAFCICENKDADQLLGYRATDQRFCFRYIESTIPLFSKSEISSL